MSKSGKKNIDGLQEPVIPDAGNTGNYLRTLRIGKRLSIKDVSEATRISASNLNAIEDQNFAVLPAATFTRGLVNIYAHFLNADAESIVARFMEEREEGNSTKRRPRQKPSSRILAPKRLAEPTHFSSMTMAGILLLVIVATFTGYCIYTSWNPFSFLVQESTDIQSVMKNVFSEEKPAPSPQQGEEIIIIQPGPKESEINTLSGSPEEQQPATEMEAAAPSLPEGDNDVRPEALAEAPYTVSLKIVQDTGIELVKDAEGPVLLEFRTGDAPSWSAESSLTISFSRPESAEILVNSSPVAFPTSEVDGKFILHVPEVGSIPQADE